MTPLFGNGPAPQTRIFIALIVSVAMIFVDHKLNAFEPAKVYLNSLVSPILYVANLPQKMFNWSSESLTSRQNLIEENAKLRAQHLLLSEKVQRMAFLERENDRLRALLDSPLRQDMRKMIAEVMSVESNPNSHQVVINRGALNGVYEGQAVLDENGIVGQVVNVGSLTSRVLLITDHTHAIPVRVARNAVRSIASGTGRIDRLELNFVPHSADIQVGDLLMSSGLGNKYPEGYPVAEVTQVSFNESLPFAQIVARPIAHLDRIRYLLLLWPPSSEHQPEAVSENPNKEDADSIPPKSQEKINP
ncbi:rod shape-determining protein MreC [Catenovulum sp. 2E275]|uniref:rod shape-determining protein MreC n=1 Tax=Catenovulum sp. 2E275 TaxID=2980497 RepID=UPI0021D26390|nr:rod shape-determining protein MreC [Catenovulum sp. 2E275]MCU4676583.1 rod shape-determining protein MreC [Catenovulum sp. 2E275]